jgi:hypothetical protein
MSRGGLENEHDVDRIEMGCVGMMRMQWGESARAVLPPYYALLAVIKPCDRSCASKKEKKKKSIEVCFSVPDR